MINRAPVNLKSSKISEFILDDFLKIRELKNTITASAFDYGDWNTDRALGDIYDSNKHESNNSKKKRILL